MPNVSGSIYGLTILCPIKQEAHLEMSHSLAIRMYLQSLPQDQNSMFAKVSSTHIARLFVMNDVIYFGMPSCEEHLKSQYLAFESNFDGDLDSYLRRMATEAPTEVDAIWHHCEGYPGLKDVNAFITYMKKCQLETTFFFADVNNKTVQQTLRALQVQSAVTAFLERNQGKPPAEVQKAFGEFIARLRKLPEPIPGSERGKEFTDILL